MNEEQLTAAIGTPTDVNRSTSAAGVSEQWCYGMKRFVYLDDGIVTSIQD